MFVQLTRFPPKFKTSLHTAHYRPLLLLQAPESSRSASTGTQWETAPCSRRIPRYRWSLISEILIWFQVLAMSRPRYDALLLDTRDEHALFSECTINCISWFSKAKSSKSRLHAKSSKSIIQVLPSSLVTSLHKARGSFEIRSFAEATDISLM